MMNTNYKELMKEFSDDLSIFNHLYDIAKENRNKTMMDAMNRAIFLAYQTIENISQTNNSEPSNIMQIRKWKKWLMISSKNIQWKDVFE